MLKPDRVISLVDQRYFCEDIIERGTFLVSKPGSTGFYELATIPKYGDCNKPLGICLEDVVEFDFYSPSGISPFFRSDVVATGGKVSVAVGGKLLINVVEDKIDYGDIAWVDQDGKVAATGVRPIGRFLGNADGDGFAWVELNFEVPPLSLIFRSPTADEKMFIRGIRENPTEEFPKLIFIDYLRERGDERALRLEDMLRSGVTLW